MKKGLRIVLASHGLFAASALETLEMIAGKQPNITAITLYANEGVAEMMGKYENEIEKYPTNDFLILTDIFGGTPSNASLQLLFQKENIQVYSGFNLPLLLEVATMRPQQIEQIDELIKNNWDNYLTDINLKLKERGSHVEWQSN